MPDISQLEIEGQVYDIKDAAARADLAEVKPAVQALQANVGDPLIVSSASAFSGSSLDTTKVYVYVGADSGSYEHQHWYYHNGSAWTDGGLWGAGIELDANLSNVAKAAQAKATGDKIEELKNELKSELSISVYGGIKSATFEVGDLSGDDGSPTSSTTRARTTDYITYADTDVIINPEKTNVPYIIYFYQEDETFIRRTAWDSSLKFLSNFAPANTGKYKIVARMSDNAYITDAKLTQIQKLTIADNTGIPGGELPYKYPVALTDEQKKTALNNMSAIKTTRNLWPHGDAVGFTKYIEKSLSLAAGTYVISAEIISTKDGNEALNYNARIEFRNGSTTVLATSLTRYGRSSRIITLDSAVDNVRLYASNTSANSTDSIGNWRNIQIENGKWVTPYIDHEIIGDIQKSDVKNDEIFHLENITINGNESADREWRFVFNRQHKDSRNVIIDAVAKYTGTDENNAYKSPRIRACYTTTDQGTCYYKIGENGQYSHTLYRLPPIPDYTGQYENYMLVQMMIPAGFTLTIKDLVVRYDNEMNRPINSGLQIDTHCAFMYYPEHTFPAADAAQKCGATRLITIPKCSSDGVWFAYHDDTFDTSTTILRNSDGTAITDATYNGQPFSNIPWDYLENLTVYKESSYGAFPDVKLMKIADFFKLCGKTGAKPMFSLHPVLTVEEYQSLYALTKKYGMLKNLTLKPANVDTAFPRLVTAFGEEIESYGLITTRDNATDTDVQTLITAMNNSGLDRTKVKLFIELWVDKATPAQIAMILNAGYSASLAGYSHTDAAGVTGTLYFSEADYDYWTSLGVTEFTENHNPSLGLNW